jgi:hypothetical protein
MLEGDAAAPPHQSLSTWVLFGSSVCVGLLAAAILGSSYTGLAGDWLSADVVLGGQIFLATAGLTQVTLRNERGSQLYELPQLCEQQAGTDGGELWCALDAVGRATETLLTMALVPAVGVLGLSAMTALQNCCVAGVRRVAGRSEAGRPGVLSGLYNGLTLLLWAAFWAMAVAGMCVYAYQMPPTLGMGDTAPGRSYGLLRACVLYASLTLVMLLARAFSLWDTATAQALARDVLEARLLKRALYSALFTQLGLYLLVCTTQLDYGFVVVLLGLNYLSSKAPTMLWAYALLALATLPQDLEQLASLARWERMDAVERAARGSFAAILALKGLVLLGMLALHTKLRFRLQFFDAAEAEDEREPPPSSLATPYATPPKLAGRTLDP